MSGENAPAAKSGQFWVRTLAVEKWCKKTGTPMKQLILCQAVWNRSEFVGFQLKIGIEQYALFDLLAGILSNVQKNGQFWVRTAAE